MKVNNFIVQPNQLHLESNAVKVPHGLEMKTNTIENTPVPSEVPVIAQVMQGKISSTFAAIAELLPKLSAELQRLSQESALLQQYPDVERFLEDICFSPEAGKSSSEAQRKPTRLEAIANVLRTFQNQQTPSPNTENWVKQTLGVASWLNQELDALLQYVADAEPQQMSLLQKSPAQMAMQSQDTGAQAALSKLLVLVSSFAGEAKDLGAKLRDMHTLPKREASMLSQLIEILQTTDEKVSDAIASVPADEIQMLLAKQNKLSPVAHKYLSILAKAGQLPPQSEVTANTVVSWLLGDSNASPKQSQRAVEGDRAENRQGAEQLERPVVKSLLHLLDSIIKQTEQCLKQPEGSRVWQTYMDEQLNECPEYIRQWVGADSDDDKALASKLLAQWKTITATIPERNMNKNTLEMLANHLVKALATLSQTDEQEERLASPRTLMQNTNEWQTLKQLSLLSTPNFVEKIVSLLGTEQNQMLPQNIQKQDGLVGEVLLYVLSLGFTEPTDVRQAVRFLLAKIYMEAKGKFTGESDASPEPGAFAAKQNGRKYNLVEPRALSPVFLEIAEQVEQHKALEEVRNYYRDPAVSSKNIPEPVRNVIDQLLEKGSNHRNEPHGFDFTIIQIPVRVEGHFHNVYCLLEKEKQQKEPADDDNHSWMRLLIETDALGIIETCIVRNSGKLSVDFRVDHDQVRKMFQEELPQLRKQLAELGVLANLSARCTTSDVREGHPENAKDSKMRKIDIKL